ncbi:MAG: hypothetical protein FGM24_09305 [Candidatus Kapabacteria bacterium]|nr:hypothetical protein [Candidatus Kapabacteria bacterium]
MKLQLIHLVVLITCATLSAVNLCAQGSSSEFIIRLVDPANQAAGISIGASSTMATSYTLTLPPAQGSANQTLTSDGSGVLSWSNGGAASLSSLTGAVSSSPDVRHYHPQTWTWNTLGATTALTLSSSHTYTTTGYTGAITLFSSALNQNADTVRGLFVENAHTGTTSTNIGIDASASGGSLNIGLQVTRGNSGFLLSAGTLPSARFHIGAGTATLAPLKFTSGTNLTNAEKSAVEYDGTVFYTTIDTLARGVLPSKYFVILDADNTLTSSTAAQAIFDGGGGPTNGAIDLPTGMYEFEMLIHLTSLSATSGFVSLTFGGTSTRSSFSWRSFGAKPADVSAPNGSVGNYFTSTNAAASAELSTATTNTAAWYHVTGIIRISAAGTLIPNITLSQAAAGVVKKDSYFKINRLGSETAANVGRWK